MTTATGNIGHVTQIIGSTFDAEFDGAHLPGIYNAVKIETEIKGLKIKVTGEVQQHLGGGRVRCVALGSTDGMVRGMDVLDTGGPVTVPVGKGTLGRVFNVLGDPDIPAARQKLVVSADHEAPQGIVVQAMLQARTAGAQHFLIAVKHK